ncbi:MAG: glycosyltransferase, partial [Rhodomicrobium sp.]|nr:glycosyltransferase [Rhodomicrobium sp.]
MTLACLDSIVANRPAVSFEVIVVDNASTDDSVALAKRDFP